jgi:hypothetical protein
VVYISNITIPLINNPNRLTLRLLENLRKKLLSAHGVPAAAGVPGVPWSSWSSRSSSVLEFLEFQEFPLEFLEF